MIQKTECPFFVEQKGASGIGIARLFVGQILKMEFKIIPYFQRRK
jgi:hypothetical protein